MQHFNTNIKNRKLMSTNMNESFRMYCMPVYENFNCSLKLVKVSIFSS